MSEQGGDRIRERAYRIWQEEGEPHGRHEEHWARAEQESQDDVPPDNTPAEQVTSDAVAEKSSEPAATAVQADAPAPPAPAKPKARRTTKKGAA